MIARVLARIARGIALVAAVVTLTFFVNAVLPSDPARMVAGPQARPADVAKIRISLGLDRPPLVRFGRFARRILHISRDVAGPTEGAPNGHENCGSLGPVHVDLGRSFQQRRPVVVALGERIPRTLALAGAAVVLQGLLGLLVAVIAVRRPGTLTDRGAVGGALVIGSLPSFVVGIFLQFVFARTLHWLPLDGFGKTFGDQALSLLLPATTLGLVGAASYARILRDELARELARDHVRTAQAKGAGPWRRLLVHALRNALPAMVTLLALDFGQLAGGAVVTESLFRWPGLGNLGGRALLDRDGPMLVGVVLVTAIGVVVANGLADLLQTLLDPRLRRRTG
jgi:peptide/nickel transport system permease protein